MGNNIAFIAGLQILIVGCIFLFMWIRVEGRRNARIPELKSEDIWRCSICTYVYVDAGEDELSTCPRCSSINKRRDNDTNQE
jgi:uncharacterized paraquat-inducible protein A